MKKVICERDIRLLEERGEQYCQIGRDTIITPSARDAAVAAGISFVRETPIDPGQLTPELICSVLEGLTSGDELPKDFLENLISVWDSPNSGVVRGGGRE